MQPTAILPRDSGCMSKFSGKLYGGVAAGALTAGMVQIALGGFPEQLIETDSLPVTPKAQYVKA